MGFPLKEPSGWGLGAERWARSSNRQAFSSRLPSVQSNFSAVTLISQVVGACSKLSATDLKELSSIAEESNAEIFFEQLLVFAERLEAKGNLDAAAIVYAAIPGKDLQGGAQQRLDAFRGNGLFGAHAETLLRGFVKTATDYRMIIPMMLGTTVFGLTRAVAVSRVTRNLSGKILIHVLPFGAELFTFALSSRFFHQLSGGSVRGSLDEDLLSAGLTLGAMRLAANTPLHQAGMFASLLMVHKIEEQIGLRPHEDGTIIVSDTLASMLSLSVGGHLGKRILGPRYLQFQAELAARQDPTPSFFPFGDRLAFQTNNVSNVPQPELRTKPIGNAKPMLMSGSGEGDGKPPTSPQGKTGQSISSETKASTALVPIKNQSLIRRSVSQIVQFWDLIIPRKWKFWRRTPSDLAPVVALRKAAGWQVEPISDSTYQEYNLIAQQRSWPLKMVMARALKNAPVETVEAWMERLFRGNRAPDMDLVRRLEWIQQGKIRGGWKFVVDSLRSIGLDGYRGTMLLEIIHDLQFTQALPELYRLLEENQDDHYNQLSRMEVFKTILSVEQKDKAVEFLDQQLQQPWLNGPIQGSNHWPQKHRRQALRIRTRLNWERTGDNAAALQDILQGQSWEDTLDRGTYRDTGKKILKNFDLLLRMGADDPKLLTDLYSDFKGDLLQRDRLALVEALLDQGQRGLVDPTLSQYREYLLGKFQFGYTEQARILAKAGEMDVALNYFRRVVARPGRTDRDRVEVLKALVQIEEKDWALQLAEELLRSPEVSIRAAALMDFIQPGWDHFFPKPLQLFLPYR